MSELLGPLRERVSDVLGLDEGWQRPRPPLQRQDVLLALGLLGYSLLSLELMRSAGGLDHTEQPVWVQWLVVAAGSLLLVGRRRWPLTVAFGAAAHMFLVGILMPQVMGQLSMQLVYFFAILSAVAWAVERRTMVLGIGAIVVFMFAWIAWQFTLSSALDDWLVGEQVERQGWFGPVTGLVGATLMMNALFFGGAVVAGAWLWNAARSRASLARAADTISSQADRLTRQALVDERLRLARELHDVVAHHVSAIGVQAGAARRVLQTSDLDVPVGATTALGNVETVSREAVTQMRGLLGTLRGTDDDPEPDPHDAGPIDLATLVRAAEAQGVSVTLRRVEPAPGALDDVERGLRVSAYRTVQEALTNVARHSTATSAEVTVRLVGPSRTAAGYLEVEVTDSGRPRVGTSGTGLGQLGIRERAATHHGSVEIGPRVGGGYRVRVRFPTGGGA